MADLADHAAELEHAQRERALARAREAAAAPQPSAKWCQRCGERIPDARRAAVPGVQRCVECAARQELMER